MTSAAFVKAVRDVSIDTTPAYVKKRRNQDKFEFYDKAVSIQNFAQLADVDKETAEMMLRVSLSLYLNRSVGADVERFLALFLLCYRWVLSLDMFWANKNPWSDVSAFDLNVATNKTRAKPNQPHVLQFHSSVPVKAALELRMSSTSTSGSLAHRGTRPVVIQSQKNNAQPSSSVGSQKSISLQNESVEQQETDANSDDSLGDPYDSPLVNNQTLRRKKEKKVATVLNVRTRAMTRKQEEQNKTATEENKKTPRKPGSKVVPQSDRALRSNVNANLLERNDNIDKRKVNRASSKQAPQNEIESSSNSSDEEVATEQLDYEQEVKVPDRSTTWNRAQTSGIQLPQGNSLYVEMSNLPGWITGFPRSQFYTALVDTNRPTQCTIEMDPAGIFVIVQVDAELGGPYVGGIVGHCHDKTALSLWAEAEQFGAVFEWIDEALTTAQLRNRGDVKPYMVTEVHHPVQLQKVIEWYRQLYQKNRYHGPCRLLEANMEIIISPPLSATTANQSYGTCSSYSILPTANAKSDYKFLTSLSCFDTAYGRYLRLAADNEEDVTAIQDLPCMHCRQNIKDDDFSFGYGVCDNGHIFHARPERVDDDVEPSIAHICNENIVDIPVLVCPIEGCKKKATVVFKPNQ